MPFGFDALFWQAMGLGIDWMIKVALFVASLPGAVGRVTAFGTGPLLLCSLGLLLLSLLRSPLRWIGGIFVLAASIWASRVPVPDVYVGDRGDIVAVRGTSGRLSVMRVANSDTFSAREWLGADADTRTPKDKSLEEGVSCDAIGCVARLADGTVVALPFAAEAFEEDCRQAALVVSQRTAPPSCGTMFIDRSVWQRTGASALYRRGKGWETVVAYPVGYDRPWARAAPRREGAETTPATPRAPRCDAADGRARSGGLDRLVKPRPRLNTSGTARPACPAHARGSAAGFAPHRRSSPAPARWTRRGGGSA
jgi:competence protein ComEC